MTLFGEIFRAKKTVPCITFSLFCLPRSLIHISLCQPNLQPIFKFHLSPPGPFIVFASERASSSPYVLHFYPLVSHPTPIQVPLGSASRPALSGLFFPHRYYHFHPVSVHQGTARGLVPTALSILSSCSPGVSFSEPPQDLSLNPRGSGIGGNPGASPAHDPTVHLQTLRQREGTRLSAEGVLAHMYCHISECVRAQLHFN